VVRLDRYIGTSVLFSILAVLGVIVGLALLFAFIDELGDLEAGYGVAEAARYIVLTIPTRIHELLPMAALIGCLIGLGTLASSSELTIMRAAGVSLGRIVWAVMKPLLVLMLVGLLIGEYVSPWSENLALAGPGRRRGAEYPARPLASSGAGVRAHQLGAAQRRAARRDPLPLR
jgi:lipopolysaccharide export system permease protein